jgi:hypothetical protein
VCKVWIADPCGYGGNGAYSWGVSGEGIKQRCGVWRNRKREGEERRVSGIVEGAGVYMGLGVVLEVS